MSDVRTPGPLAAPGQEPTPGRTDVLDAHGRAMAKRLLKGRLVVETGPDAGREVAVDRASVTGGRSMINSLELSDEAVSGTHFELLSVSDGYRLKDLGSTNGTYVEGLRVRDVYIVPGTAFMVGTSRIRFTTTDEVVEIPLSPDDSFGALLGTSPAMREIFALLERISPSELTVLLLGMTGTGKDVVAREIHRHSPRRSGPFVVLDCSAIPADLMESTIFGHEKGAFTGATARRRGCFEEAQGGTLFLDEIGELTPSLQPKLLRVLESRELRRVGGSHGVKVDVRVVAATNRDLRRMVNDGSFREDLYFRLAVMPIELPPLSERPEDIPLLAERFLQELSHRSGSPLELAPETLGVLTRSPWPGNIRQLRNVLERAASLARSPVLRPQDIHPGGRRSSGLGDGALTAVPPGSAPPNVAAGALEQSASPSRVGAGSSPLIREPFKVAKERALDTFERAYLAELMEAHGGNISQSAERASLTRYHLRKLLKKHGMRPR